VLQRSELLKTIDTFTRAEPGAICFQDEMRSYTYGELIARSSALAQVLASGFPGVAPVICFGGLKFEMLISFIACVRSGHPYIPVDGATPLSRAQAIRDASGCCLIIATEPWPCAGGFTPIITPEELHKLPCLAGPDDPCTCRSESGNKHNRKNPEISGDDPFYIIYTSGTTGAPKGVRISHDNLAGFTNWILKDFGLKPGMRFLLQAPFSFDLSVMSLWPALLSGGSLVTIRPEDVQDFGRLFTRMPALDLNVWISTPSFVDLCLADAGFNATQNPHISHFLFCGDELLNRTAEKLTARFPGARIFNTYGPTEATVAVTGVEITDEILRAHKRLPVGTAKPGTLIAITDEDGRALKDGAKGEIIIAGDSVSKGYLNDPDQTAESFFEYDGLPAYHTGDAGILQDGQLFFKGRLDFQVKLHGYRIELQDIEQHLLKDPLVEDALVVPEYKGYKVRRLIAYIVPKTFGKKVPHINASERSKAIREKLSETLLHYMIPQKFVFTSSLPLTANGKVDRKRILNEVNAPREHYA
jgi:D-alanine--poly(phosphoribitol) ligase subunit 1